MKYAFIMLILVIVVPQIFAWYYPSLGSLTFLFPIILFPIISKWVAQYCNNRKRGVVTPTGLKGYKQDSEITFDSIRSITGNLGSQNIITTSTPVEIYLPKQEIVKLSKTILKNWTITKHSINIFPATPDESLNIIYAPVGKYTLNFLVIWIIFWAAFFIDLGYPWLIFCLGFGGHVLLQKYPSVTIKVNASGISIIEKGNESLISFADIHTVKRKYDIYKSSHKRQKIIHIAQTMPLSI